MFCPLRITFTVYMRYFVCRSAISAILFSGLHFGRGFFHVYLLGMELSKNPFVMTFLVGLVVVAILWECSHILMKGYSCQSQPAVVAIVSPMLT